MSQITNTAGIQLDRSLSPYETGFKGVHSRKSTTDVMEMAADWLDALPWPDEGVDISPTAEAANDRYLHPTDARRVNDARRELISELRRVR